jgi:hypothetical protein
MLTNLCPQQKISEYERIRVIRDVTLCLWVIISHRFEGT